VTTEQVLADQTGLPELHLRIRALNSTRLPLPQSAVLVRADAEASTQATLDPRRWSWIAGTSTAIARDTSTADGDAYTAVGWSTVAGADGLPQDFPPYAAAAVDSSELARYRDLPGPSDAVAATAHEVMDTAGLDGPDTAPAAQAAALAAWFHSGDFLYDETAPGSFDADADTTPLETINAFLTERRGYCIHYAATFTLMARSLGLPTRIAVGYASRAGEGTTTVSGQDLHAWPEVWLEGIGWVAYEPTPGGAGVRADTGMETAPAPTASATAQTASPQASPAPSASTPGTQATNAPSESAAAPLNARRAVMPWLVGVALLLLMLSTPTLVRAGRRRRRRRRLHTGQRPAAAAWEELLDVAVDLGRWRRGGSKGTPGDRNAAPPGTASDRCAFPGRGRSTATLPTGPRALTPEALAEDLNAYLIAHSSSTAAPDDAARALRELADAVVAETFADTATRETPTDADRRRLGRLLHAAVTGLNRTASPCWRLRARLLPASVLRRRR
ncbi:transglutaminase-like domain-containing protein, partial [Actinomyces sp. MRS3W]|uniref:transglutaminase domain-containing protein n=1 Tax=Actinomyces sp. MRS3W TaxID=2800796 RepID=UPI0028FD479C